MSDKKVNDSDRSATAAEGEQSFKDSPETFSKATMIMIAAAILFVIIAILLIGSFLKSPAGNKGSSSQSNSAAQLKP